MIELFVNTLWVKSKKKVRASRLGGLLLPSRGVFAYPSPPPKACQDAAMDRTRATESHATSDSGMLGSPGQDGDG
jgi:hypothetical protein